MNPTLNVYRRELKAFFDTPIAAIFIALMVAMLSYFLFKDSPFFAFEQAEMREFFGRIPIVLMVFAPVITMRLWSDEFRVGTAEILGSLPMRSLSVVLGKYFAALTVLFTALVFTLGIPIAIGSIGNPDWGPIVGGYVGSFLVGAFYVALGCWASSLSSNQVVSMLIGVFVGVLFTFVLTPKAAAIVSSESVIFARWIENLGVISHFSSIERGVIALSDAIYFISGSIFFLALNVLQVEWKRY